MKRSSSLTLVLLTTTAVLGVAAGIVIPIIADSPSEEETVDPIFANADECAQAFDGDLCRDQAADAKAIHEASAPKFEDKQACEASYGVASCVPTQVPPPGATASSGGGWFMPAMAGFMIARALSAPPTPVYYGQPPGGQNCGQPGLAPCPPTSSSSSSRGVWTGHSYVGSYSSGTASNTGTAAAVRTVSTGGSGASAFAGSSASRSSTSGVASSSSSSRGGFGASASAHGGSSSS